MAAFKFPKAQAGVFDFILATAIFALFLLFLAPLTNDFYSEMQERADTRALQSAAVSASNLLLLSAGSPQDWNESNVSSIGLASESRVINASKFEALIRTNYSIAKVFLGIGARNLWINASDAFGGPAFTGIASSPAALYTSGGEFMLKSVNGTGLMWDFYWPFNSTRDFGDSRNAYKINGQASCLNALFANRTSYDTILIETNTASLPQLNTSLMTSFVSSGGILLVEGPSQSGELLLKPFNVSSETVAAGGTAMVVGGSGVLSAPSGSNASFSQDAVVLKSDSNVSLSFILRDNANASRAFAAYFPFGLGRVYYFASLNASLNGSALGGLLNLTRARLSYGSPPSNASTIALVRRLAALGKEPGRRVINLDVEVWK